MNQPNPIVKKLQIKRGKSWLFYNAPDGYLSKLQPLPDGATTSNLPEGKFDGIQLFVINSNELAASMELLAPLLTDDAVFWITYPKKSSGIKSDLEMMGSWDKPKRYGLRIVTSISIDETWTALRFRREGLSKVSDSRNEVIRQNKYADYIDLDNRQIKLPVEIQQALANSPAALAFLYTLSFSNRKEYVVWILSAKQEHTKAERLEKLIEKLSAREKNPSEK
jgi:hypothetical protein